MKPRVFVASSIEQLSIAYAVQENLEHVAEVTVWDQGVFELSNTTIETLSQRLESTDYGVFVFGPDDVTRICDQSFRTVRENVTLEFGMFVGALGRKRCFIVLPRGVEKLHLPSDLLGLTTANYDSNRQGGNLVAALGPPCNGIRRAIESQQSVKRSRAPAGGSLPIVYLTAPHKNVGRNHETKASLENHGIRVNVPEDLVKQRIGSGALTAVKIRSICIEALESSSAIVVDLDTYGLDSAWEIGYAEGLGRQVFGFSRDQAKIVDHREVNHKLFNESFMHGWDQFLLTDDLDRLAAHCSSKSVHVCGSFSHKEAFDRIRSSNLERKASKLVLPKDLIDLGGSFPKDYPWSARELAIQLLAECDVALVLLPRYGMDTSWQIGYATALGKDIVGWKTEDIAEPVKDGSIWDHWMHCWKEKVTVPSLRELGAVVLGFHSVGALA